MAVPEGYDFSGWATKNDLKCADGRTIRKGAFSAQDGEMVPLVWNHRHNDPLDTLGHAILENREEGVYAYGYFNNTPRGLHAKEAVKHGDIKSLSIWANNLEQSPERDVFHGVIREVSLVHAGANPGAFIESVLTHGAPMDDYDEEGIFYTGDEIFLAHSGEIEKKEEKEVAEAKEKEKEKESGEETVAEVYNTLNEKQKEVVAIIVGAAIADAKGENPDDGDDEGGDDNMKHSVFDNENGGQDDSYLSHADMTQIFKDAKRIGSLREAYKERYGEDAQLFHSIPTTGMTGPSTATSTQTYGFRDPDMLFPDYKSLNNPPEFISRNMDWVNVVMDNVHHTPFSRIKSVYADITEDEARAKGYIKGKQKKDEVFTLLKRVTSPQTIYKRQKMDRDDIIDITDFDVVVWIKSEMRVMLNEEIARAILLGDGRLSSSDDKIQEINVRPIVKDVDLFNVKIDVKVGTNADEAEIAKATINAVIRGRKKYKGSGNPIWFTTEDSLTEMLLLEDNLGHKLYKTEAEVATALRASRIVTVEPMEGYKINDKPLIGVLVNLNDYNVGTDKGGQVSLFDDFDIDYNQYKYLIETRISGALVKPFSAVTVTLDKATTPTGGGNGGGGGETP